MCLFLLGMTTPALSQFGPSPPPSSIDGPEPPPTGEPDGPEPPPSAPINKYLPILIVAGLAVGYAKLEKNK